MFICYLLFFLLAGGLGSTPYKENDDGIFISRVTAGGPADLAGLRKDDKVIGLLQNILTPFFLTPYKMHAQARPNMYLGVFLRTCTRLGVSFLR